MNAAEFNSRYPVGTPVFAYPGFRPEDASDARRLVTRTRTKAQTSASGDPVVWVDGEGSYICLTHVDPVSTDEWEAAKTAETALVEQAPKDTLAPWLYQRFAVGHIVPFDALGDADRTYWEHEAAAVRRAVTRGGCKSEAVAS